MNLSEKPEHLPALAPSAGWAPSPLAVKVLNELKRCGGESSAANLGRVIKESNGMASNPGTLAATSILRSLEKRGVVARRWVSGKGYGRTLWRILPNGPISQTTGNDHTAR